jgi:hypothetical protein
MREVEITITIPKQGKVSVDFSGFEGQTCFNVGEIIANGFGELGITFEDAEITPKDEALRTTNNVVNRQSKRQTTGG